MKIFGVVPARMNSSRFPGKPLALISGRPMIEHVYCRANMFNKWDSLSLATCDTEIFDFAKGKNFNPVMTSDKHERCLDRVAEAITHSEENILDSDIVVCVQGDEPMLHPEMIDSVIDPLIIDSAVLCSVLAMEILHWDHFIDPNTVKIVHDMKGDVLYTSRSPIPHCKKLTPDIGARRIYGIFAFRWGFLKTYTGLAESPLELKESCDSNRIMDHGYKQRIAPYPYRKSFSVDSPADLHKVESVMMADSFWGRY